MKVQIEGRVLGDLAINHIVPTAVAYQNRLLENLRGLKEIFPAEEYEVLSADRKELIREISHRVTSIKVLVREMTEARKVANHMDNYKDKGLRLRRKKRYARILTRFATTSTTWRWKWTMKYGHCLNTGNCYLPNKMSARLHESSHFLCNLFIDSFIFLIFFISTFVLYNTVL